LKIQILIANEPRAYREAIADTFTALCPDACCVLVEPAELDREVARVKPHLVVCSSYSAHIDMYALAWVMLYPEGRSEATISIDGQQIRVPDIEFNTLLDVLDQVRLRNA